MAIGTGNSAPLNQRITLIKFPKGLLMIYQKYNDAIPYDFKLIVNS